MIIWSFAEQNGRVLRMEQDPVPLQAGLTWFSKTEKGADKTERGWSSRLCEKNKIGDGIQNNKRATRLAVAV